MDIVAKLIEIIEFLWPFRRVSQYERGGFYVQGKWRYILEPGVYSVIPWWEDIKTILVSRGIVSTRKLDLSLEDGKTLYFMASADRRVLDPYLALNEVDDWKEQAQEVLEANTSDQLAKMDVARLTSGSRARLLSSLTRSVAAESLKFGVELSNVRFLSFVLNAKTHRVIMDQTPPMTKEYDGAP